MIVKNIPINSIQPDPSQPRRNLTQESIDDMARSIKEVGMLQPIIVKYMGDYYMLVAGERRFRAARRLDFRTIPAVILGEGDYSIRQVQIVENVQREDLDPLERAIAIREYMSECKLTKAAAARKLGIPRTTLSDWLCILEVGPRYQELVVANFTGGDSPLTLSHIALAKGLSVALNDSTFQTEFLEVVLEYELSRGEARKVCNIVRENPSISVEEAAVRVRGSSEEKPEKKDMDKSSEKSFSEVLKALQKCLKDLERLFVDSRQFLTTDAKEKALGELVEMSKLIERAIPRLFGTTLDDVKIHGTSCRENKER